ncbi:hypothetical protein [Candidatus Poriferisodalis sp.]|uniref:hypothetical protein n=1 Tax=Candidatus Poriferisodalis sp. TaxID=3101277 RepID=UPI003B015AC7
MRLRDTTVVCLCAFLGITVLFLPLPVLNGPYEDLREGEVDWTCSTPLLSLAPPDVDIDEVRDAVADARATELASGQRYVPPESRHPLCGSLARTQVVLALLALAGAFWRGRRWWRSTAGTRAEKRFKRLHESVNNPQGGPRIFR